MKKFLMLLFTLVITFTLVGCGDKKPVTPDPDDEIDYETINKVIETIDELFAQGDKIKFSDENTKRKVEITKYQYDNLKDNEKELVTNYDLFTTIYDKFQEYLRAQEELEKDKLAKEEAMKETKAYVDELLPKTIGTKNLDLPYMYETKDKTKVYISWKTSDAKTINTTTGIVNQPRGKSKMVTLTATIKCGDLREEVSKKISVVALPYTPLPKKPVFAYFMSGISGLNEMEAQTIDVLNLSFAGITGSGDISIGFGSGLDKALQQRKQGTRVLFSLQNKEGFKTWTKDQTHINTFTDNIVRTIEEFHFDGVDIDWEYPAGNEVKNYTLFLKTLNEKLKKANPEYLLTSAVYGGAGSSHYDIKHSHVYLDYVHLMTYDLNSRDMTSHLTALGGKQNRIYSVVGTVDHYVKAGVPKDKLVIGAAFYGKIYEIPSSSTSFYWVKPSSNPVTISYARIKHDYLDQMGKNDKLKVERLFDSEENAYYLGITEFDDNGKVKAKKFITYDDPESVKMKAEYVFNEGLAGLMFWELGEEDRDSNDLVKAINSVFSKHK